MSYLIPESATRLQATAFVTNTEIDAAGGTRVLRMAAEKLAEQALRKLMDDCMTTESHDGYAKAIRLDVFVIAPAELDKMLLRARLQGERDALQFTLRSYQS